MLSGGRTRKKKARRSVVNREGSRHPRGGPLGVERAELDNHVPRRSMLLLQRGPVNEFLFLIVLSANDFCFNGSAVALQPAISSAMANNC